MGAELIISAKNRNGRTAMSIAIESENAHLLPLCNIHGFDDYSEDEAEAEADSVVWKAEFDARMGSLRRPA